MASKPRDLTGQRFGRLIALRTELRRGRNNDKNGRLRRYWLCRCDCGNETYVLAEQLTTSRTQSCGCLTRERTSETSTKDLTGMRFGRLTVSKRVSQIGEGKVKWLCQCDCGNTTVVKADNLNSGSTLSCGCYNIDKIIERNTKHGKRYTRLYNIFCDMKKRCYNKNSANYKNYGERGIIICDEWLNDFNAFYNWAMENNYGDTLTIDRKDNDGNYEPDNCRWITKSENSTKRNMEYWAKKRELNEKQKCR